MIDNELDGLKTQSNETPVVEQTVFSVQNAFIAKNQKIVTSRDQSRIQKSIRNRKQTEKLDLRILHWCQKQQNLADSGQIIYKVAALLECFHKEKVVMISGTWAIAIMQWMDCGMNTCMIFR